MINVILMNNKSTDDDLPKDIFKSEIWGEKGVGFIGNKECFRIKLDSQNYLGCILEHCLKMCWYELLISTYHC